MSATLGDVDWLATDLTRRTGREPPASRASNGRCRCTTTTRRRPSTKRSKTCCQPGRPRSTSCISRRPRPSNARRRWPARTSPPGTAGCDCRVDRRVPIHDEFRQDPVAPAAVRHRGASRGNLPQNTGDSSNSSPRVGSYALFAARKAGCRHQCADPYRAAHGAHKVRRNPDAAAQRSRVPPGRGPCRPSRLRHRWYCRRAGTETRPRMPAWSRKRGMTRSS